MESVPGISKRSLLRKSFLNRPNCIQSDDIAINVTAKKVLTQLIFYSSPACQDFKKCLPYALVFIELVPAL